MSDAAQSFSTPVKAASGIVAALVVILGAGFAIDERYAHAGDMRQLSVEMQLQGLDARQTSLRDKIFDLEQKKRNQGDNASLSRYQNELKDVERDIAQKRQMLDQMKAGR
ncbi:MAG: hypothetical protein ABI624_19435 [Casimicrobiaceae bacterium]